MLNKCDRCGKIAKIVEVINRPFNNNDSINLCGRCGQGWKDFWMKTYGRDTVVTYGNKSVYPIEPEDLWKQFMGNFWEKVEFD